MGFWYFLMLFIGITLLVVGLRNKDVSHSVKIVIMSLVIGVLFIVVSLIMLMPGSSEVVGQLLQRN
jgi:zinc transporter ZupT